MRTCKVEIAKGQLCGCIVHNRLPALPMCDTHLQMIYEYAAAESRGLAPRTCDFYHWAHAGLVRSREATN